MPPIRKIIDHQDRPRFQHETQNYGINTVRYPREPEASLTLITDEPAGLPRAQAGARNKAADTPA